jgi:hypothetical protein
VQGVLQGELRVGVTWQDYSSYSAGLEALRPHN